MTQKKLAILSTHPIQYNAPLFTLLSQRNCFDIMVFYTWGETVLHKKFDPGFGKNIQWDIPLLKGYKYEFVKNIAAEKGSHHFKGIDNPELIAKIKSWNPSAILVFGWSFKSHLSVLRYFYHKIPVLFRGDSTLLDPQPIYKRLLRNITLRWVYRHIDIALYTGKENRRYFEAAGLKKRQLLFAPHAIDNKRFAANEVNKYSARLMRERMGIDAGHLLFLYAGKLEAKKDPGLLIHAFLEANLAGTSLCIVGNGPMETALKNEFGKATNVFFLDFQNQAEMPAVYQAADVFVLPSKGETWGLAVNEAMAGGKPVIVSDACGCASDLIVEGVNGYMFEHGSQQALVEVLKEIYNNRNSLPGMAKASLQKIQEYSLDKLAEAVEAAVNICIKDSHTSTSLPSES